MKVYNDGLILIQGHMEDLAGEGTFWTKIWRMIRDYSDEEG